jgi:hypothetical protein
VVGVAGVVGAGGEVAAGVASVVAAGGEAGAASGVVVVAVTVGVVGTLGACVLGSCVESVVTSVTGPATGLAAAGPGAGIWPETAGGLATFGTTATATVGVGGVFEAGVFTFFWMPRRAVLTTGIAASPLEATVTGWALEWVITGAPTRAAPTVETAASE